MFVRVVDSENECSAIEIPVEEDGCVLLSTICAHYPGASGLKYCTSESGVWRAVRVSENNLSPSEGTWADVETYHVAYPKGLDTKKSLAADAKRKVDDDGVSDSDSKLRRMDTLSNGQPQCTDLIVLGVNFKSTENVISTYFKQYGELALCEIKRDYNGNSKGFGFIRFEEYDAQIRVLKEPHHMIDGRSCQTKIPESKNGSLLRNSQSMRKIFVARLPQGTTSEDLRTYFEKFGEVVDVYMSQPFRSFAFVTFKDSDCVQCLFTQNHILNGSNLHIGPAEPKGSNDSKQRFNDTLPNDWSSGSRNNFHQGGNYSGNRNTHRYRGDNKRFSDDMFPGRNTTFNGGHHYMNSSNPFNDSGIFQNRHQSPMLDQSAVIGSSNGIDLTSMASMLTPSMMAAFLNIAAAQQQQNQHNMMAAVAAATSGSPGTQSDDMYSQNVSRSADYKAWQRLSARNADNRNGNSQSSQGKYSGGSAPPGFKGSSSGHNNSREW